MTRSACPDYTQLLRTVDRDLSQEQLDAVAEHTAECARCRQDLDVLQRDVAALRAPIADELDVAEHVRAVMSRLSDVAPNTAKPRRAPTAWVLSLAACAVLGYVAFRGLEQPSYQARGATDSATHTIARDVAVQAYVSDPELRPLMPGSIIRPDTPLTAGYRNLGVDPAYLLLFAVDAESTVHWISPPYLAAREDPLATRLAVGHDERLLPELVVFEGVATGRLRIVAVVTPVPSHVSDIESLEAVGANTSAIMQRLPHAEVREWVVEVRDVRGASQP